MLLSLVLPPLTQLNTPYPSISYLAHFLRQAGIECEQRDLGIEFVLQLFSRKGLIEIFAELDRKDELPEEAWRALSLRDLHLSAVEPVVSFLQGKDESLAARILSGNFLPAGTRIQAADLSAFGNMGTGDAARHLATLYLAELADLISSCLDDGFALTRYQAHLATSARSFDGLWKRLGETRLTDRYLDALGATITGDIVGLSVPFPGNLYAALRIGRGLRERGVYVVMGGGYVNTELREVEEARLWTCVDALTYDDGEGPLLAIIEHRTGRKDRRHRTRTADGLLNNQCERPPSTFGADYQGLDLGRYMQTIDTLNPAHRLWAEGRWNKITLAHGCYWKRCSFCDVSLDYIGHYEAAPIVALVDHMQMLIEQTGQRGFHFVDEAAPPKLLRALAIELLARDLKVSFWGNIRFEKSFDADLCRLLSAAGLIAVTGGLEVADDRLLERIDKGVTVDQVACAAAAFQEAGVMVHAYLMYGFPTQTVQETIDSMELVRQLFAHGLLSSAFWHRFVLTRHAPIFKRPADFGVQLLQRGGKAFADNDVPHSDPQGCDHDLFDSALPLALASWLQGRELERPVESWFETRMPTTTQKPTKIAHAIEHVRAPKSRGKLLWIGGEPLQSKDGLMLHTSDAEAFLAMTQEESGWVLELLEMARPGQPALACQDAIDGFPGSWQDFAESWSSLRELGLLII